MNSNTEQFGNERSRQRIKVGSGKNKRTVTIRQIIYVKPKRLPAKLTELPEPRVVEWGHRWWVRGSWHYFWADREAGKVDETRIGKCRDGCYCQQGRTWHVEHQKGLKDAPVASKVRVVDGVENQASD